jgi:urease gamma subunit
VKLNREEAYYILKHLEVFVERFEESTNKKVTPGAIQIIHEILTEASFPEGLNSENIH